jgi:signal recognition particle subunit SRP54
MLPGMGKAHAIDSDVAASQLKLAEAIVLSMTPQERRHPDIIDGSRRRRIARGSGTTVQDVNNVLRQCRMLNNAMKQLGKTRLPGQLAGRGSLWP